jgi:L-threonylcarbamoyladenylate synthase
LSLWHIRAAARILRNAGVIAYPTESVFGIGCLPFRRLAVERVLAVKRRRPEKGLILVASAPEQIEPLVVFDGIDRDRILATWPGPVTWVLPASRMAPELVLGAGRSIAVRVSAHPLVRRLCETAGPLVSTSANPAGRPPARNALQVRGYFRDGLDMIVPGRPGGASRPSEIRDGRTGAVLRP